MPHTQTTAGPIPVAPASGPFAHGFRQDWALAVVLVLAAFLLFYQLGQRPFWQDEAETACLAKSVLATGLPYAFDGTNVVSQEEEREFDKVGGYLWRWSPWIQIYMQAAGFAVGGLTAAAGRLPFALAALLAIFWTYRLVARHFGDRSWALLAATLLTLCVPYLLIGRQARYYAPGTLFVLWTLDAFLSDWQRRTGPLVAMFIGMILLFHANYLLFLSFAPTALAAALGVAERMRQAVAGLAVSRPEQTLAITVSLGVAEAGAAMGEEKHLFAAADRALYAAKAAGKNCCRLDDGVAG